jgi:CHAT domain-containing protein
MCQVAMLVRVVARFVVGMMLVAMSTACRASFQDEREDVTSRSRALADLSRALPFRPIAGRLAVKAPHRPHRHGSDDRVKEWPADALEIARGLSSDSEETSASTHARAVLELMMGGVETARTRLVSVAEQEPTVAAYWIDVSAAHLAEATRRGGDARVAVLALDAAVRASAIDPARPEGWFNQGLALEMLRLPNVAAEAWRRARETEADAGWKNEIDAHARRADERNVVDWPAQRAMLLNPAASLQPELLSRIAKEQPHLVRQFLEDELLPAWGNSAIQGRTAGALLFLDRARALTDGIGHHHGDSLLSATIAAIDAAATRRDASKRLASAHEAYGAGVRMYEETRREAALAEFRRADGLFSQESSPFALKARLQIGVVIHQLNRSREAHAIFAGVIARAAGSTYPSLRARAEWLKSLAATKMGRTEEAIAGYHLAAATFERIGDGENLSAVASAAADTLRLVGEQAEGWEFLARAIAGLPEIRSARRRYTVLLNLSLYAADEGLHWSALVFQDASLAAARERGAANTIVEALTRRAQLYVRVGEHEKAARDLAEATALLPEIPSASARAYVAAWLDLARGELEQPQAPALAASLFARVGDFFAIAEPDEIPRLRLRRGRALMRAGLESEAQREWFLGVSALESRWRSFAEEQYRVSYLDEGWGLFDALIEFQAIRRHDQHQALELAERGRARVRAGHRPVMAADLSRLAPPRVLILYYVLLDERALVWAIDSAGIRFAELPITKSALRQRIRAYLALLDAGRSRTELAAASEVLYETLIAGPLRESALRDGAAPRTIAVIADGFLNALPFATLRNPRTKRYLVEDAAVTMAPSATHLMEASSRLADTHADAPANALLIGGASRGERSKGLPALPQVNAELRDIARLYPRATTLTDSVATLTGFESALPGHTVLHFAGHAIANDSFPWRSHLLLAPEPTNPSGALSIRLLERLRVSGLRLAVLSACRTAAGPALRGEGVVSLARPFLEARVPAVIGTLWDVDDAASRKLLVRFHETYLHERDAVRALQSAQLALLSSTDERLAHPRSWGSHVAISGLELGPKPLNSRHRSEREGTRSPD